MVEAVDQEDAEQQAMSMIEEGAWDLTVLDYTETLCVNCGSGNLKDCAKCKDCGTWQPGNEL